MPISLSIIELIFIYTDNNALIYRSISSTFYISLLKLTNVGIFRKYHFLHSWLLISTSLRIVENCNTNLLGLSLETNCK